MSLKAFHIVFVGASVLLAFGFGAWSLAQYSSGGGTQELVYGIGSLLAGFGLIAYGRVMLRKLRHISYL